MDRDEIIRTLRQLFPHLQREHGVASLGIFGSVARGDDGPESDLDVLITFDPKAEPTLLTLGRILNAIEDAVGRPVDLIEDHARLRPSFRQLVERDLVRVA